jgi:hypothetical protein
MSHKHVVESTAVPADLAQAASYDEEFTMPEKTEYRVVLSAWPAPDQPNQRLAFPVRARAYDQTSAMNAMRAAVLGTDNPATGRPFNLWYKLQQLAPNRQYVAIHFE